MEYVRTRPPGARQSGRPEVFDRIRTSIRVGETFLYERLVIPDRSLGARQFKLRRDSDSSSLKTEFYPRERVGSLGNLASGLGCGPMVTERLRGAAAPQPCELAFCGTVKR